MPTKAYWESKRQGGNMRTKSYWEGERKKREEEEKAKREVEERRKQAETTARKDARQQSQESAWDRYIDSISKGAAMQAVNPQSVGAKSATDVLLEAAKRQQTGGQFVGQSGKTMLDAVTGAKGTAAGTGAGRRTDTAALDTLRKTGQQIQQEQRTPAASGIQKGAAATTGKTTAGKNAAKDTLQKAGDQLTYQQRNFYDQITNPNSKLNRIKAYKDGEGQDTDWRDYKTLANQEAEKKALGLYNSTGERDKMTDWGLQQLKKKQEEALAKKQAAIPQTEAGKQGLREEYSAIQQQKNPYMDLAVNGLEDPLKPGTFYKSRPEDYNGVGQEGKLLGEDLSNYYDSLLYDKVYGDGAWNRDFRNGDDETADRALERVEELWNRMDAGTMQELFYGAQEQNQRQAEISDILMNGDRKEKAALGQTNKEISRRAAMNELTAQATGSGAYNPDLVQKTARWNTSGDQYWDVSGDRMDQAYFEINNPWRQQQKELTGGKDWLPEDATPYWSDVKEEWFLSDDEKYIFNQFYNSENKDQAQALLEGLHQSLSTRKAKYQESYQRDAAQKPFIGAFEGLATIAAQPVAGIAGTVGAVLAALGNEEAANPNSDFYTLQRYVTNTRDERGNRYGQIAADAFGEKYRGAGKFLYGVGMSMADNLMAVATANAAGMVGGFDTASKAAERIVQGVMSGSATAATMVEQLEAGKSPLEAATRAIAGGVIEWATEKYSVEALLQPNVKELIGDRKGFLKYMLKNTLAEGSEEVASDVLNTAFDGIVSAIAGHESEIGAQISQLESMGMSRAEASSQVWGNWMENTGLSFIGGALSGMAMSGGRGAINAVSQAQTGKQINSRENIKNGKTGAEQILQIGLTMDQGTQSRALAEAIAQKGEERLKTGKGAVLNHELGQLAQNIMEESGERMRQNVRETVANEAAAQMKAQGVSIETARPAAEAIAKAATEGIETLNREERATIAGNDAAVNVLRSFITNRETNAKLNQAAMENTKEQRAIRQEVADLASGKQKTAVSAAARDVLASAQNAQTATEAEIRNAIGKKTGAATEAVYDGQIAKITGVKGDSLTITINGREETVPIAAVKAANTTAATVLHYAERNGNLISDSYTTKVLEGIERNADTEAGRYLDDAMKIRLAAMSLNTMPETSIDRKTAQALYDDARAEFDHMEEKRVTSAQPTVKPGEGAATFNGAKYGTQEFQQQMRGLTRETRNQAGALAEIAVRAGMKINFINDENQQSVYGWEDGKTGEITINLAGEDAGGMKHHLLVTAGHEMTHWLEQNSREAYGELRQFVLDSMRAQGVNIESRLMQTIDDYNAVLAGKDGQELLDLGGAMAELVANSCDQVLGNEQVIQRLSRENPSLFDRVRTYVSNFVARIRAAVGGMGNSASREARQLMRETDRIAALWLKAYDEGISAEKNGESAGDETVRYSVDTTDPEDRKIKLQVKSHIKELNQMVPIKEITSKINLEKYYQNGAKSEKAAFIAWANEIAGNIKKSVYREGLGNVLLNSKAIKTGLRYINDPLQKAAFAAVPDVIEKGIEINYHEKHKGGNVDSHTFAAPIIMDGEKDILTVVVRYSHNENRYKTHKVFLPDGSVLAFGKEKAEVATTPERNPLQERTYSASDENIPQKGEDVNRNYSVRQKADDEVQGRTKGETGEEKTDLNFSIAQFPSSAVEIQSHHTEEQKETIREYLGAVDNRVLKAAQEYKQNKNAPFKRISISQVTNEQAKDIKAITGFNVAGYMHDVDRNFFKHVEERHGENGKKDTTMKDLNDVARIGFIIENYDSIEKTGDEEAKQAAQSYGYMDKGNNPMPMITYKKQIDGTLYVVEAVGENKWKKLHVITAYMQKNNSANNNSQSNAVTRVPRAADNGNPEPYVRNAHASPADKNISQKEKDVNRNYSIAQRDETYTKAVENGDMETAQRMVDEAADQAGYTEEVYHGTPTGGFTVFRDWSYFTKNKEYADRYQNPSASSIRGRYEETNRMTYKLRMNPGKVFDTRNAKAAKLYNEARIEYGLGELSNTNTGLPDWTDGRDIIEFIEDRGLDYDTILLDEGGDPGENGPVSRGISYVTKSNRVKSAEAVTRDDQGNVIPLSERFKKEKTDIRYSARQRDEIYNQAVKEGDEELQRDLVRQAAAEAGYDVDEYAYHGTEQFGFTNFDLGMSGNQIFVAFSPELAGTYTKYGKVKKITEAAGIPNYKKMKTDELAEYAKTVITKLNGGEVKDIRKIEENSDNIQGETDPHQRFVIEAMDLLAGENSTTIWQRFELEDLIHRRVSPNGEAEGIYQMYTRPGKQLEVYADGSQWDNIPWYEVEAATDGEAAGWEEKPAAGEINTRNLAEAARAHGYDSVKIYDVHDDGGLNPELTESAGGQYFGVSGTVGIFFHPDDVKSADLITRDDNGNIIPLSERFKKEKTDIRYSIQQDSDGNQLTPEQQEFFKDSKAVDDKGRLVKLYHGTEGAGFTKFEKTDDIGYFFTSDKETARTYSGSYEPFTPKRLKNWDEFSSEVEKLGYRVAREEDGRYRVYEDDGEKGDEYNTINPDFYDVTYFEENELKDAEDWLIEEWESQNGGEANYEVYLNLKDPLIIDGRGSYWNQVIDHTDAELRNWDELTEEQQDQIADNMGIGIDDLEDYGIGENGENLPVYDITNMTVRNPQRTREWVREAQEMGYDGVIFRDIIDEGQYGRGYGLVSDVYVALHPEQIKSVNNMTPTDSDDIRYSIGNRTLEIARPEGARENESVEDTLVRYAMAQSNLNVNSWMLGLNERSLATVQERNLLKQYKDLRMTREVAVMAYHERQKELQKLEAKENKTAYDREQIRKLTAMMQNSWAKLERAENDLVKVTSSEGYAGMMYEQSRILNELVDGRTAEEVRETTNAITKALEDVTREMSERAEKLKELAEAEGVASARAYFANAGLGKLARKIKADMNSNMAVKDIENRLALITLKMRDGQQAGDDVADLAGLIIDRAKSDYESYALSELRGRTFTISKSQQKELKGQGGSLREIQKQIAGSGVRIRSGEGTTLDVVWDELCDKLPRLNRDAPDTDMLGELVDLIRGEMRMTRGGAMQGQVAEVGEQIMEAVFELMGQTGKIDKGTREMLDYIRTLSTEARDTAQAMGDLQAAVERMKQKGGEAREATSAMGRKVEKAIEYFNTLTEQSEAAIWRRERVKLIEQMKSDAAEAVLKEQEKWKQRIEKDKTVRDMMAENAHVRSQINTNVKRIRKLLVNETDQKNIPENMKGLAREMLKLIVQNDLNGKRKLSHIEAKDLSETWRLLTAWENQDGKFDLDDLKSLGDEEIKDVVADALADIQDGIGFYNASGAGNDIRVNLKGLKDALDKVQKGVSTIAGIISSERSISLADRRIAVEDAAYDVLQGMQGSRFKGEWKGKIGRGIAAAHKAIVSGNTTPVYFIKNLRNQGMSALWHEFERGENRNGLEMQKAKERIASIAAKTGYNTWDTTTKYTVSLHGEKVQMTLEQMMALYATWKREKTMGPEMSSHLENGGVYINEGDMKEGVVGREKIKQKAHRVDDADMATIMKMMTPEQKEYIDKVVAYLSKEMSDLGNEASMRMYGIEKYKESYYFPMKVWSGVKSARSDQGISGTTENRAAHQSWSKRRKNMARNALVIENFTDTAVKHIVEMINYNTMAPAVENLNKVLNFQEEMDYGDNETKRNLRVAFAENYGKEALSYLETFIKDLNGGAVQDQRRTLREQALSMFKKNAVAGSMSVAAQQPLSYIRAAMMINPKYLAGAINPVYWKGSHKEMVDHSGVAVIKDMGRFDMNFGQSGREYIAPEGKKTGMQKTGEFISEKSTILPELMDRMTWTRMWSAVKLEQHKAHPEMGIGSDEFLNLVADRFNDVMRKTQVYDSVLTKSQNMRSNNYAMKLLTSFMAEPTLSLNVLGDAVANIGQKGGKATMAKAGATFLLSAVAQAAVKAFMGAGRSPDEKKTFWENVLNKFGYNIISEANPVSMIPGYSDVIEILKEGELKDDAMGVLGKFKSIIDTTQRALKGEGKGVYRDIEDSAGQLAQLFTNVPVKNLMRDARAMYNWFKPGTYAERETSPAVLKYQAADTLANADNLLGVINGWLGAAGYEQKNAAYYQRIYEAKKAGDTAAAEEMTEYLKLGRGVQEKTIETQINSLTKKDTSLTEEERASQLIKNGASTADEYVIAGVKEGTISREKAEQLLKDQDPEKDENDIWWRVDRAEYQRETGNEASGTYYRLKEAINNNRAEEIKAAVQDLTSHGVKKESVKSKLSDWKSEYLEADSRERIRIRDAITKAYKALGYTAEDADKTINGWTKQKKSKTE